VTRRKSEPRPGGFWHRYGRRIAVGAGGAVLLAAGVILSLPFVPGPGFLLILAGLGLLATEFDWAERRLAAAKERFQGAARNAGVDPKKATIGGILFLVLLTVGGTVLWFLLR
jgi:uncharacterized protein (TIGR02611 family)